LLINIATFLTFLNVVLKGLKQDTFNGCNACDMFNGNVIMFNANSFAYFIASWVTSSIKKCQFVTIMYDQKTIAINFVTKKSLGCIKEVTLNL
jgi:hypothetical protein